MESSTKQKDLIMMKIKSLIVAATLVVSVVIPFQKSFAFSSTTGQVTPNALRITFTKATLIKSDNSQVEVFNGSFATEFTRSGTAFAAIPLTTINVPTGTYIGVIIGFSDAYEVKLDGDAYIGSTAGGFAKGDPLCTATASTNAKTAGTVTEVAAAACTPQYVTIPAVSNCTDCSSTTYFSQSVEVTTSSTPNISILIDLYQSIYVDGSDGSLSRGAVYPFVVLGTPGAAIHLASLTSNSDGSRNVSVLFGSDKKIHSVATWGGGGSGTVAPGPVGGNWVTATAGTGINAYGPTMFADLDSTAANGTLKFPMGNCPGTTCTSSGLATITGLLQAVGSTAAFTCSADTTGALGYTYTGGDCSSVTTGNMKITRIIDPQNLFNICTTSGGVCSATSSDISGTSSDGYL
jgi:hypothetical protein